MDSKFKVGDLVCLKSSDNSPKMKVKQVTSTGLYLCVGKNYQLSIYHQNIRELFAEGELTYWIDLKKKRGI